MLTPDSLVILSASGLLALSIVAALAAWSWQGWLRLQQHRFEQPMGRGRDLPVTAARIEVADLRERIRKLEAIAAGVEL